MLKRKIAYEDFDGNKCEEEFNFNLNKTELLRLEVSFKGGLAEGLTKLTKKEDNEQDLLAFFEKLILSSYGVKSEDGKKFIKLVDGKALSEEFSGSAAYDALIMEMVTNAESAGEFVIGVMPRDLAEAVAVEEAKQKAEAEAKKTSEEVDVVAKTEDETAVL